MSQMVPDPQGAAENAAPSDGWQQMVRFTLHVPVRDSTGREIPHVLNKVRQALTNAGLSGRTVIRRAQGDWQGDEQYYETSEMDLIMIDAPENPSVEQAITQAANEIHNEAGEEAIYITKTPISTKLIYNPNKSAGTPYNQ